MRCFGQSHSIQTVNQTSSPLRSQLWPGQRNRFFATCWLIVLAPRSRRPLRASVDGFLDRLEIESVVDEEFLVLGGDRRDRCIARDLRPGHPVVTLSKRRSIAAGRDPLVDHEGGHRHGQPAESGHDDDARRR